MSAGILKGGMFSPSATEKPLKPSLAFPDGRRDISMSMRYWRSDIEKGTVTTNFGTWYEIAETMKEGGVMAENTHNFQNICVVDARTHLEKGKDAWEFDENGFCYMQRPDYDFPPHKEQNRRAVDKEFGPMVCEAVRQKTGAKQVFWCSHQRRAEDGDFASRPTVGGAHSDYGPDFEPQYRTVLEKRFGVPHYYAQTCGVCVANLWTPVCNTAYAHPLAYLDGSTVDMKADTVRWILPQSFDNGYGYQVESIDGKKHGRPIESRVPQAAKDAPALAPVASPHHRWVFLPDMREDEAVLFKQVDFRPSSKTKVTFHAGIQDPMYKGRKDLPGRKSIECRLILIFDPEDSTEQIKAKL